MLGSVHDAEDALQEALLRAWRGLPRFEGRSSLRSWLYTIATNTCLDAIGRRPKRVLPVDYGAGRRPPRRPRRAPSSSRSGSSPTRTRLLGPRGRVRRPRGPLRAARGRRARVHRGAPAPAGEAARGADPARGARVLGQGGRRVPRHDHGLGEQRAAARPRGGRRAAARAEPAGDPARARRRAASREIVDRYVDAWERGDVDAVVAMLAEDATFAMPPLATWFQRPRGDRAFLARLADVRRLALAAIPVRANGQPALAFYSLERGRAGLPAVRAQRPDLPRRADLRRDGVHRHGPAGARPRGRPARLPDQPADARTRWRPPSSGSSCPRSFD